MLDETALLRRYVENADEAAFTELVRRRVDFVYSAALRQVGRDAHLAQDVTQGVFLALARSSRSLVNRPTLTGWLYTTTRFLATKAVRSHRRWQAREQEAQVMNETETKAAGDPNWEELRPVLDGAMHELGARDREAILLRYFENRPYAEIAAACGLNENAARMRVERALDRLRSRLIRRGVTSSAAALALALSTQTVAAAPAGLAATVVSVSLGGIGSAGATLNVITFMSMTKAKLGIIGAITAVLAAGVGGYVAGQNTESANSATVVRTSELQSEELLRLREQLADPEAARVSAALHDENERLKRELQQAITLAQKPQNSADGLAWLRILADLQKRRLVQGRLMFLENSGKLTPAFLELFELTPTEGDQLQEALDRVRQQLDGTLLVNATVSRRDADNVVIEIPPMTGGEGLYDGLFDTFAQTLGPERNALFFEVASPQVEQALSQFGAEKRSITITRIAAQSGGNPTFRIRDERKMAFGAATSGSTIERSKLGDTLGAVANLLPADF